MTSTSATLVRLMAEKNSTMFKPNRTPPGADALTIVHVTLRPVAATITTMTVAPSHRR